MKIRLTLDLYINPHCTGLSEDTLLSCISTATDSIMEKGVLVVTASGYAIGINRVKKVDIVQVKN